MKAHFYLLFFSLAFIADKFFSVFFPGYVWLTPIILVVLAASDSGLDGNIFLFTALALLADVFSGFPLGVVSLGLIFAAVFARLSRGVLRIGITPASFAIFWSLLAISLPWDILVKRLPATVGILIFIQILCYFTAARISSTAPRRIL